MSTILFSYTTIYKVATRYTPYHFVYGLHLLMPTKYVLLAINGDHRNVEPVSVLIAIIVEQRHYRSTYWKLKQCWRKLME